VTARDRFAVKLRCPKCGNSGIAQLSQEDGWSYMNGDRSTQIDALPEGFEARTVKRRLKFFCVPCGIEAQ
jgi:hypothetical protein